MAILNLMELFWPAIIFIGDLGPISEVPVGPSITVRRQQ